MAVNLAHCPDCLDYLEEELGIVDAASNVNRMPSLVVDNTVKVVKNNGCKCNEHKRNLACPSCGAVLDNRPHKFCIVCGWEEYPF